MATSLSPVQPPPQQQQETLCAAGGAGLPELQQLRWRVDVVLATSACARVLKPSVLVQLQLSDGTTRCVELSVKAFHELRYKVCKQQHVDLLHNTNH